MRTLAVLIAASCLSGTLPARAGTGKTPAAHAPAAHQQMQHQQQLYQQEMKRQQEMAKKQLLQQQQAYQQQMKAAQALAKKTAQQQQQAARQQAKSAQAQQHKTPANHQANSAQAATNAGNTSPVAGTSIAHAAAPHNRGHGYRAYPHRTNGYYRHHTRWPNQVDPETAALVHLRSALDGVGRGVSATPKHSGTIATALNNVIEVDTPPSSTAVHQLAEHLTAGLSHRQASGVDTGTMALALRGVMNSPVLPSNELASVMNQHHAALRAARFKAEDIAAIQASLKAIANQERGRR